ncbi:MAG: hypothetical protein IJM82_08845 [Synergistaceae bacterium]|nr:hypothetical protein [Synergistaceae bacterium]MBR0079252.1 hypothetical protein [Synergistaceae bacterium]MBR0232686.1 hypothetical protein [Synergistaceae bacterium]
MYSKLPYVVYGFHGCDESIKNEILHNHGFFTPSQNSYDWLGEGIYFWENDPQRAMEFATDAIEHTKQTKGIIKKPAVIGAAIDLGYCLNLLDRQFIDLVELANQRYIKNMQSLGEPIRQNKGETGRFRDCAVINFLHALNESTGEENFDSVRCLFREGNPLYENSGFYRQTHIQICIRNPNCIKAVFDPREADIKFPVP